MRPSSTRYMKRWGGEAGVAPPSALPRPLPRMRGAVETLAAGHAPREVEAAGPVRTEAGPEAVGREDGVVLARQEWDERSEPPCAVRASWRLSFLG